MAAHNELGTRGETIAADYLRNNNFQIIALNWRYLKLEVDIIAENDEFIIFIEVKTRRSIRWGNPEEAVNDIKIRRIIEAADFYINENNIDKPARFDVITILLNNNKIELNHIEDAFFAPIN